MTPTHAQLRLAAEWLQHNEGESGEADDCHAVAAWLLEQAEAAEFRALCRDAGVSVKAARAAIAKATGA